MSRNESQNLSFAHETFLFYSILSISQSISKRASQIHKVLTFPFRAHTQQRLVFPFCKTEVSMLIKCNLNILFQITLVLRAISSTGSGISCVLGIM